jgi:hypothetical protein
VSGERLEQLACGTVNEELVLGGIRRMSPRRTARV